jgi:predicted nucleic-acid-binding Zn-ribbon protein
MRRPSYIPCPDCGKKHYKMGQVLVQCPWNQRGTPPPGGYQLTPTLQCKSCGYSPLFSGFLTRTRRTTRHFNHVLRST